MKRYILLGFMYAGQVFSCPQIDMIKKDIDGMPFCPSEVTTTQQNAWAVYSCAIDQANSFHVPTAAESAAMHDLLSAHQKSVVSGVSQASTSALLGAADKLNLQACRVKQKLDGVDDSYLLVYVKPNVKDYSGPFLMLRETNPSKVMLIGPHDDSDNTFADTKIGLASSHALVLVSNGHKRGNIKKGGGDQGTGDFVHETDNLGTKTVGMLGNMYPGSIWLHIHGMVDSKKVLYRSRNDKMGKLYEASIRKHTNIEEFGALNADFTVDSLVNTDHYLKTEIPVRIHQNNPGIVASIARDMEALGNQSMVDPAHTYKYAPHNNPVSGTPLLTCLGIKYQDTDRHADAAQCRTLAAGVSDFYNINSRGAMKMKHDGYQVNVALDGNANNVYKAEQLAIDQHKGSGYYAIVGLFESISHAGGKIAHLLGTLQRDANHEVGHLLGLGHAGAYKPDANGNLVLDAYADGGSVMGKFASGFLTAPQYYHQGWLPENEAVMYEPGKIYDLKRVNDFQGSGLAVVIVPGNQWKGADPKVKAARDAYVSFPIGCDSCAALHLGIDGGAGSQRVKEFGSEYYDTDFSGLHIKIVKKDSLKVSVTLDFADKPK